MKFTVEAAQVKPGEWQVIITEDSTTRTFVSVATADRAITAIHEAFRNYEWVKDTPANDAGPIPPAS